MQVELKGLDRTTMIAGWEKDVGGEGRVFLLFILDFSLTLQYSQYDISLWIMYRG